jgi:hypothetical protein
MSDGIPLGKLIGCGRTRSVWEHRDCDDLVIKMSHRSNDGLTNRMEWEIWNYCLLNKRKEQQYFAPCVHITSSGLYLIMKKGVPCTAPPKDEIPYYLTDTKDDNWVIYKERTVMCDYARDSIMEYFKLC